MKNYIDIQNKLAGPFGVIIMVAPSGMGKSTFRKNLHNVMPDLVSYSMDEIREEVTGDFRDQTQNHVVARIIKERVANAIAERKMVLVDAMNLRTSARREFAEIALQLGGKVNYIVLQRPYANVQAQQGWRAEVIKDNGKSLVQDSNDVFHNVTIPQLRQNPNDGLAHVVLHVNNTIEKHPVVLNEVNAPVTWAPQENVMTPFNHLMTPSDLAGHGFDNVRVIADLHGEIDALDQALLGHADRAETLLVFLGDLTDRGSDSIGTLRKVHALVRQNRAIVMMGNHDWKLYRWAQQLLRDGTVRVKIGHGMETTMREYDALHPDDQKVFLTDVVSLYDRSPHALQLGSHVFTHAAFDKAFLMTPMFRFPKGSRMETRAIYGMVDGTTGADGKPSRSRDWTNDVPSGFTVYVGHDVYSVEDPVVVPSPHGGKTIFLDTGCGTGGKLSWVDIPVQNL